MASPRSVRRLLVELRGGPFSSRCTILRREGLDRWGGIAAGRVQFAAVTDKWSDDAAGYRAATAPTAARYVNRPRRQV